jgi:hypothetical protein
MDPIESDVTLELKTAVAEAQALAREQLGAVWQLNVDRVREQLESGWHQQIDQIFTDRFSEITSRLHTDFERAVGVRAKELADRAAVMARTAAQRELIEQLNQTARRLEQAESREVWIRTLLEATNGFCSRAALFAIQGKNLRYEGGKNLGDETHFLEAEIPLTEAPAFQNAAESKDTVIAIGTRGELSGAAADFFGDTSGKKVYLFPLVIRQTAVGVLYAEPGDQPDAEPVDVSALELLSLLAANSIESAKEVTVQSKAEESSGLIRISGLQEPRKPAEPQRPAEPQVARDQEDVHLRARRFARTQVAQMLLYKAQQVRQGRSAGDLYGVLNEEIDAGRNTFRQQFLSDCPSMVDYYHDELVERLANGDVSQLGAGYPGSLV